MTFLDTAPQRTPRRLATANAAAVFLGLRQTERQFMAQVTRLATLLGWRVYHTHDSRHSPAGWPDLVLIRRPRIIFAELKAERGRLTADQRACLDELRACGQEASVWRPSDWETIERVLR